MLKNRYFFFKVAVLFIFSNFCMNVYADNASDLSFVPFQICKKPPSSPPKKLLDRRYKIYMQVGNWAIFDINGDGWCDWVRGGHEGCSKDNEDPPMRDFIYLGTSNGWRHFDQAKPDEKSKNKIVEKNEENVLSQQHNALNFYQPIAIYRKGKTKPYIATVVRYDAPAPPPNRNQIDVYRWSDQIDKLLVVSEKERDMVIDFLRKKFCMYPPTSINGEDRFILAMGNLCEKYN